MILLYLNLRGLIFLLLFFPITPSFLPPFLPLSLPLPIPSIHPSIQRLTWTWHLEEWKDGFKIYVSRFRVGAADWRCTGDRRRAEEGARCTLLPTSLNPGAANPTGRPLCDVRRGLPHERWAGWRWGSYNRLDFISSLWRCSSAHERDARVSQQTTAGASLQIKGRRIKTTTLERQSKGNLWFASYINIF